MAPRSHSSRTRGGSRTAPSARLTGLLAGDLPDHRLEAEVGDGSLSFVPNEGGPVIGVWSRTVRRFLGRTEIAVFEVAYDQPMADGVRVELRHRGALRRSGLAAEAVGGGQPAVRLAGRIEGDDELAAIALPLDFTSFVVLGDADGCRAQVELMGASHVAMAMPPMRSWVRLHPDQRRALVGSLTRLGHLLDRP